MPKYYTEVTDDACHHYVIPYEKLNDWYEFFEDPEYAYKDLPDWADRVDGGVMVFENYTFL